MITLLTLISAVTLAQGTLELNKEYPVAGEEVIFRDLGERINRIQEINKAKNGSLKRGFHAKGHCLKAKFTINENIDARSRRGLFEKPGTYPAWVRFSNAQGTVNSDKTVDARGMAIKLMGIPGEKLLPGTKGALTQDFLMTNQPSQIVATAQEFMEFAETIASGNFATVKYFATHKRTRRLFEKYTRIGIDSLATENYWSGAPYGLIDKDGKAQAVKFMVRNCNSAPSTHVKNLVFKSSDYLSKDLVARNAGAGICYDFFLQFQTDPNAMPVEDASVAWDEEVSHPVPVARVFMKDEGYDSDAQNELCENMSFTPWHAVSTFQPWGNMNRARKLIYQSSAEYRLGSLPDEPSGF